MVDQISALKAAGYDDEEIAAWSTERRDTLKNAGFSDNEIDAHFAGGVVAPDKPPLALTERVFRGQALGRMFGKMSEGMAEGFGSERLGLSDDNIRGLQKLGIYHDPTFGPPTPLQFMNETAVQSLSIAADTVFRGMNAVVHGSAGWTGQLHDELGLSEVLPTGMTGERLKREFTNAANWAMIEFGMGKFVRARGTQYGLIDEPVGGLAKSDDFVNAAKVTADETAPRPVQEKLLTLYEQEGRHPAEVASDAQSSPVIQQRLLSKDPKDMPYAEKLPAEGEPPPPSKPPEPPLPPEPGSFAEAQAKVLDRISVGEAVGKRPWSLDRLYTEAIDDLHPLKAVSENAYEMARLTRGQFGKAEHFLEYGTFDFKTYETTGKPLREILAPVRDDLSGLRAYLASKRAIDIEATGRKSGIDLEAAQRVVDEGGKQYGAIASDLGVYQNNVLKYLKDSGVLSKKSFEAITEANKNYVPFYRVMGTEAGGPATGKGFGPGNPVKKLKGSEREIVDPVESIIKNTYAYVSIAERNAVGVELIDALKKEGFKAETKRAPPTAADSELVSYLREQGVTDPEKLVEFVKSTAPEDGTTIGAFREGVRETVKVNDPELVAAFQGLDRQSAGMLTKIFAVPAKALRAGAVLTPDFMARNLIRDFLTAFINTSRGVFTPFDTAKGLVSVIRKDADFQNWTKAGGANSTFVAMDRAYLQESLTKLSADTGLMTRSWNIVTSPLKGLRMISELVENATRVGEFKKVVGTDLTKEAMQAAAFSSREVTLDFARMGARMRAYNMVTAFANAQIQGMDRIVRAFADRPVNTMAKVAGGITLPSVLLWWANHDDPRYQELPNWQRDLFWIIPTDKWEPISALDAAAKPSHLVRQRGSKFEFNNGSIWRIPKPFELGVIFGSGVERALDATVGQSKEAFSGFTKSVMQVIVPNYLPTAVQPLIEQWANRSSFTDRTLIPADMEKHLPEYQYTPYTTELSKRLGQVISSFPGIRTAATEKDSTAGPAARALTSPILIENYVRSWTGGLGVYAMEAADAALRKAHILPDPIKPTATLADIPFIKAFAVRYPSATAQSIQDFHDEHERNKRFFDTWMAKAKEGDVEAMERIQAAGGPRMFGQLDAIKETLTGHSKLIRDVYKNPDMPADEKRQLIDSLYYSMIQIGHAGRDIQRQIKTTEP